MQSKVPSSCKKIPLICLFVSLIFVIIPFSSPQVPRMVEGLMSHHCSQVAAAKDHTVVLTEEGYVYTFGLNTFHQLGLAPPPASAHVPKQVGGSREANGKGLMTFSRACNEHCLHAK